MKYNQLIVAVFFFLILVPTPASANKHTYQTAQLLNIDVFTELASSGTTVRRVGHLYVANNNVVRHTNFFYTIQLDNIVYNSVFSRSNVFQHNPSADFVVGTSVEIRIHKSKLYIKRSNGKELKTKILKKELGSNSI